MSLKLLSNSKALIGNSSVGIRECSFLGVPVVNIGSRQNKRERGKNILDVSYGEKNISNAIEKQISKTTRERDLIFGSGNAGAKIAEILSKVELRSHKTLTY